MTSCVTLTCASLKITVLNTSKHQLKYSLFLGSTELYESIKTWQNSLTCFWEKKPKHLESLLDMKIFPFSWKQEFFQSHFSSYFLQSCSLQNHIFDATPEWIQAPVEPYMVVTLKVYADELDYNHLLYLAHKLDHRIALSPIT